MNLPQRHIPQVDQIGLVLRRHTEQLYPVEELRHEGKAEEAFRMIIAFFCDRSPTAVIIGGVARQGVKLLKNKVRWNGMG